jgi:uncharacterized protein YjiS (DUF1127 family)
MTFSSMAAVGQFTRSLIGLAKVLKHRREIRNLEEFDDRMLRDIGLMRGDVSTALAEPLLRNPSWVLVRSMDRNSQGGSSAQPVRQLRPVVPIVTPARRCA